MTSTSTEDSAGPLDDVVVLDLSRVLAGPYATMLLADMGATVIKVESPSGDETRTWRPPETDGESTYFQAINRNKRSIALDLKDEADRAVVDRLLARADVLVENFRPGGLARFGLDYDSLAAEHPHLIYASLSGFGHEGAGAALPGYDVLVQGASGLMHVTGEPDGAATKAGVAVCDVVAGLHLYGAILAALHERGRSGRGQHVQANLLSSMLSGLVNQTSAAANTGVSPQRMGNEHPSLFPYGPFPTADGQIVIACGNDRQFVRLCRAVGADEAAEDERWTSMSGRNAHRDALRDVLCDSLRREDSAQWLDRLQEAGIPCAPVNDVVESLDYAESLGLQARAPITREDGTTSTSAAHPVSWSRSTISHRSAPPRCDEHRDEILRWAEEPAAE
ncbi:MAG: CoA transferase [Nesterenkonia sp.]|nr:CoA transferase [Nesterenkonia sp.]